MHQRKKTEVGHDKSSERVFRFLSHYKLTFYLTLMVASKSPERGILYF